MTDKENKTIENKDIETKTETKFEPIDYKKLYEEAREVLKHKIEISKIREQAQAEIIKAKKIELEMSVNNPTYQKYLEHSKGEGFEDAEIERLDKIINRKQSASNKKDLGE